MPKTTTDWVLMFEPGVRVSLQLPKRRLEAFGPTEREAIREMLKLPIENEEVITSLKNNLAAILQSKENNNA